MKFISLCVSLRLCVINILVLTCCSFLPLCNKSVSDLLPMSVFALSVAWEPKFRRSPPIWACKYSPRLITKPEHRATGSLSHSLNKVRIGGEAVGMVASARPPKTKWDVFVCSSTVRSTIPIGYEWASLWCITVQRLCVYVCVPLCFHAAVPARSCVLWSQPPRTVHVLAVIDETPQKQRKG